MTTAEQIARLRVELADVTSDDPSLIPVLEETRQILVAFEPMVANPTPQTAGWAQAVSARLAVCVATLVKAGLVQPD